MRCFRCGFEPQIVVEMAKSIVLSDDHLSREELLKYQAIIQSKGELPVTSDGELPFDSVALACIAHPISDRAYFEEAFDPAKREIACKRCGKTFPPEREEVYCIDCALETEQPLPRCNVCHLVFNADARHLQS
jgi:hypothetical protein